MVRREENHIRFKFKSIQFRPQEIWLSDGNANAWHKMPQGKCPSPGTSQRVGTWEIFWRNDEKCWVLLFCAMFCNIWLEKGNHHEKHLRTCWAKKRLSFAHRYHKGSRSKNDCRSLCRTLTEAANKIGQHGKTMTLIANIQELHCLLKTWVLTFLLYHGLFATWADVAISASAEVQMPPARTFTFSTLSVTSSRVFASALMISLASTRTALICHQGIAGKWF